MKIDYQIVDVFTQTALEGKRVPRRSPAGFWGIRIRVKTPRHGGVFH
jgi:hypothetical protein